MLLQHFAALLLANLFRNHPENRKYMTYHYASEEDRATAIGNTRNNTFGEDRTCSSDDMIADRQTQTDRQTDRQTRLSQYSALIQWCSPKKEVGGCLKQDLDKDF